MNATARRKSRFRLFFGTVGRRVAIALVSTPPPDARDADGTFRTIVYRRPAPDESVQLADFHAVRADLINRRHIRLIRVEWFIFAALVGMIVVNVLLNGGRASWPFVLSMIPIVLLFGAVAGYRAYLRSTRLETAEEHITTAWLRQGCCPHCAYRLPACQPGTVRCTECGSPWQIVEAEP